jgi:hypothetical protein
MQTTIEEYTLMIGSPFSLNHLGWLAAIEPLKPSKFNPFL